MHKVLTGNSAVSHAVRLARAEVIAAYPITPQTSIVEELAEMCADGRCSARFIHSESEHSSMSACIGASAAGARAFTATSSQGLAYMHEMLHWAAGGRHPVVMAEVNRSLAPPWTIYTDQQDSLSQRDTGWLQFYCRDNQEVLDSTLLAFKVAERVSLPAMVVLDAFVLSHTVEPVDIPDQSLVDRFLPRREAAYRIDPDHPAAFGGMKGVQAWMETRVELEQVMEATPDLIAEEAALWKSLTGRCLNALQAYRMEDAEVALLAAGTAAITMTLAVDHLREAGIRAGALGLWLFRPFPVADLRRRCERLEHLVVFDRSCSYGHGGIFAAECRSALYDLPQRPRVIGLAGGLGGREIDPKTLAEETARRVESRGQKSGNALLEWFGVRGRGGQ